METILRLGAVGGAMQAKYQLNEIFFAIKPKKMDSWVWNCILKNRQQFRKGVRWKVGNRLNSISSLTISVLIAFWLICFK